MNHYLIHPNQFILFYLLIKLLMHLKLFKNIVFLVLLLLMNVVILLVISHKRDIRSLMEKDENYENLFSSAAEYLESIRSNADSTVRPEVVTCAPCDTISFICAQMEKYSVHRVFISSRKVVKGQVIQKPVGIVTMSDLIKLFAGRGKGSLLGGAH
eukprot:UN04455